MKLKKVVINDNEYYKNEDEENKNAETKSNDSYTILNINDFFALDDEDDDVDNWEDEDWDDEDWEDDDWEDDDWEDEDWDDDDWEDDDWEDDDWDDEDDDWDDEDDDLIVETFENPPIKANLTAGVRFIERVALDEIIEFYMEEKLKVLSGNILSIIPFVSKETANNLFLCAVQKGETIELGTIVKYISKEVLEEFADLYMKGKTNYAKIYIPLIASFLSKETVTKMFINEMEKGTYFEPHTMAPYVLKEDLDEFVNLYMAGKTNCENMNMSSIASLLSREVAGKLFIYLVRRGDNVSIHQIISYIPREELEEFVDLYVSGKTNCDNVNMRKLAPYISREAIGKLFINAIEKGEDIDIYSIIPFIGVRTLDKLVEGYVNGKYQNIDLNKIYPFLSKKSVTKLFTFLSKNKQENCE